MAKRREPNAPDGAPLTTTAASALSSDPASYDTAPFQHLTDRLLELELRLRALILDRRVESERLGAALPLPPAAPVLDDPDALRGEAGALGELILARIAASSALPPLLALAERFALDAHERDALLIAAAPSVDGRFARYYAALHPSHAPEPTVDLCLSLWTDTVTERLTLRRVFREGGRLAESHLLLIDRDRTLHGDSFLNLALRPSERALGWLLGETGLDVQLRSHTRLVEPAVGLDAAVLPEGLRASIDALIAHHAEYRDVLSSSGLGARISHGRGIVMAFIGPPGTGKTFTAEAVAKELGKRLLVVDPAQVLSPKQPIEVNLAGLFREAHLQNAVVFFDECESLLGHRLASGSSGLAPTVLAAMEHFDGVIILATNLPQLLDEAVDRRLLLRAVFEVPSVSLRRRLWESHLPSGLRRATDVSTERLAADFELTGGHIKNAVLVAVNHALGRTERPIVLSHHDLETAARSQIRARISDYAERTPTPLRLADMVLPPEAADQVTEILAAARSRSLVFQEWGFAKKLTKGRGLSALFDGEPGTGKTLCAEILAAELGLVLYRINVANVVSKYIGETEKNLTRVFQEAENARCLLLFDEADALFGQRTEMKSVNDKYANMEINVLLQLVERHEGIVVLTTNLKKGIDKAFERRISYKVYFPFPEPEYRERIWRDLLPQEAPLSTDVDFWVLGQSFELSGGSIKNALLRAAYRAAAAVRPISMDDLLSAAKYECAAAGKLYRVVSVDEFG
ncbi:MAG: ATP-binding protein [Myxococcales bacterium]|nr:ATP-binding protein [Myxococcales bacterium]